MWAFIFRALFAGLGLGLLYLGSRFARFSTVRRAAGKWKALLPRKKCIPWKKGVPEKLLCFLIGLVPALVMVLALWKALGVFNAAICVIHLTVIWILCDGVNLVVRRKRGRDFERYYAGVFALGITFCYLACGWYLAHHVWRTAYALDTEKQVGNLRIVLFADSHVGSTFDGEGFGELVERMQEEQPDIVVVVGDYVDDDTTKEDMVAACEALGTLETTYGVYYAFGNHDKGYFGPAYRGYSGADLVAELERNGVTVLQDETVLLGGQFYLIGRQDRSQPGRASMEELTAGLDRDRYSIVLDHQPYEYDAQAASGVDLVLSGHTHGGQLFPFHRFGEWLGMDAKIYGLERRENTDFIVTSGISDWTIQFKTGCRSEYVVVDVLGTEP